MFKKKFLKRTFAFAAKNLLGTIIEVSTSKNVAALTFDDGPSPEYTPLLLELLDKYNAKATFFVVGKQAGRYPHLIKQIINSGHSIGNHSWDHPSFPVLNSRQRRQQIARCRQVIGSYGQRLFRPPYGHQNIFCRLDALLLGYKVICWSIAAQDWLDYSSQEMAQRVIEQIRPGSIILFHDYLYTFTDSKYTGRELSLNALQIILNTLSDSYRFITIPELLKQGRPLKNNWYARGDLNFLTQLKGACINESRA